MAVAENRLIKMRATQLAIVHLTRRDDVQVTQEPRDLGVDLAVSLLEDGRNVGRLLAVEVKGIDSAKQLSAVRLTDGRMTAYRSFPIPLCLFVFGMDNDRGYWCWLQRPVTNHASRQLQPEQDATLHPLTAETMATLLNDVRDWYDA